MDDSADQCTASGGIPGYCLLGAPCGATRCDGSLIQPIRQLTCVKAAAGGDVRCCWQADPSADAYDLRYVLNKTDVPVHTADIDVPGCVPTTIPEGLHGGGVPGPSGTEMYYKVTGRCLACATVLVEGKDTTPPPALPRPALNVPYTDPVYGLRVARVTDASQVTDREFPAWVRHEYSRRPAFNADATRVLTISSNGWLRLYAVQDGTLRFLRTLDLGDTDEPNWHPTDPDRFYFFESYAGAMTISTYDVATDRRAVVRDLSRPLTALFPRATGIWTRGEGRPSDDGRIWCLLVGHTSQPSGDFIIDGLVAYDFEADAILGSLAVSEPPDHISTSPGGNYCVPSFDAPTGTRAYALDFRSYTQLHDRTEHSDLALTATGEEVLVYAAYDGDDAGHVMAVWLRDGSRVPLFDLYGPNHSSTAMHFSGTAKRRPGYVAVSFYDCSEDYGSIPCDPTTQWYYNKVVAVELKANPRIFNLAHTHFADAGYFAETQATTDPSFTQVLFASTWDSTVEEDVAAYLLQIPPCALP